MSRTRLWAAWVGIALGLAGLVAAWVLHYDATFRFCGYHGPCAPEGSVAPAVLALTGSLALLLGCVAALLWPALRTGRAGGGRLGR